MHADPLPLLASLGRGAAGRHLTPCLTSWGAPPSRLLAHGAGCGSRFQLDSLRLSAEPRGAGLLPGGAPCCHPASRECSLPCRVACSITRDSRDPSRMPAPPGCPSGGLEVDLLLPSHDPWPLPAARPSGLIYAPGTRPRPGRGAGPGPAGGPERAGMLMLFMARRPRLPDGAGPLLIGLSGGWSAASLALGQDREGL